MRCLYRLSQKLSNTTRTHERKCSQRSNQEPDFERAWCIATECTNMPKPLPFRFAFDAQDAKQGIRMACEVFRRRMHNNIGAVLEWILQRRRAECRVDEEFAIYGMDFAGVCDTKPVIWNPESASKKRGKTYSIQYLCILHLDSLEFLASRLSPLRCNRHRDRE